MNKTKVRLDAFRFLESFDSNIRTKFNNISAKTGQYDVPSELFQKRTSRKNRCLISWKTVKKNNLTIPQLQSFYGGVAVEFVNEDFFDAENQNIPLFIQLKDKIGSDDVVSSIITIRSESGSSSSAVQRENFEKLTNNTEIKYKGNYVTINKENYKDYKIRQIKSGGVGNEKWTGFLYVSIKGGQQDTIESHKNLDFTIFNPACEYATEDVCEDINLVMTYFAFMSINVLLLDPPGKRRYDEILNNIRLILSQTEYDSGNLLEYCDNHPCLKMYPGKLYDPIQIEQIDIMDFSIDNKEDKRNLDFTHDEAVNIGNFYWDSHKNSILSPARPTNVFWSKHLSNMMQQNFTLAEYFSHQEEIVKRRNQLLRQNVTV